MELGYCHSCCRGSMQYDIQANYSNEESVVQLQGSIQNAREEISCTGGSTLSCRHCMFYSVLLFCQLVSTIL